ncbi:MAG: Protein of unknown function DUF3015, partial [Deltaproteobacteria bacterium]|nr:Protein of unknown function DUF3015 [Deltaproteobacteria bacterium]
MKKVLVSALIFGMMSTGVAFARGTSQSNTGCGLGSVLLGEAANDSTALQVLVTTTNGTFANATFGITSGTLDCKQPSKFVKNERLNDFVFANIDALAKRNRC